MIYAAAACERGQHPLLVQPESSSSSATYCQERFWTKWLGSKHASMPQDTHIVAQSSGDMNCTASHIRDSQRSILRQLYVVDGLKLVDV